MRRDTQGLSFIHHPVDPVSFLSTDGWWKEDPESHFPCDWRRMTCGSLKDKNRHSSYGWVIWAPVDRTADRDGRE
jgi:hypothetical protein